MDTLGALAFSPDGRTLAYQHRGSSGAHIWLSPAAGGAPVRLAPKTEWNYQDAPTWSPDGEWIALVISSGFDAMSLVKIRVGSTETVTLINQVAPFTRPPMVAGRAMDRERIRRRPGQGAGRRWLDGCGACRPTAGLRVEPRQPASPGAGRKPSAVGHMALVEIDAVTHHVKTLNPDLGTIPIAQTTDSRVLVSSKGRASSRRSPARDPTSGCWKGSSCHAADCPWLQALFR